MAKNNQKEQSEETVVKASSKEFLLTREVGSKINYSERKKVLMLETCMRLKSGKEYDLHVEKADYLISKGVAKELR